MGSIKTLGYYYLRDFFTDGNASSGRNEPSKSDGRAFINAVDAAITAVQTNSASGVAVGAASLTDLEAISPASDKVLGVVKGDAGGYSVDGYYVWNLGTTTWTRIGALESRILRNESRIPKNSTFAEILRNATIPGMRATGLTADMVSGTVGYGFTRGFRDPTNGQAVYGEMLRRPIEGTEEIFARVFVETTTANDFGSPGLFKYPKYGSSESTLVFLTQELKIDNNSAIYSGYATVHDTDNIAGLMVGYTGTTKDLRFTGFQYARSYDRNFTIDIGDYAGTAQ